MLAGILLLAGCPKQQNADQTQLPPDTQTGDSGSSTDQGSETGQAATAAELRLDVVEAQLKLGQRIKFAIPEDGGQDQLQINIWELLPTEDDTKKYELRDIFEPLLGTDSINGWLPRNPGSFKIELVNPENPGLVLASSEVSVADWPRGDPLEEIEPFVSINNGPVTDDMQLSVGLPLVAYYRVPVDFPHESWIGLFLADESFAGSADVDDAVDSTILMGPMGQFNFWPREPGRYVVRLFSSLDLPASHVCDSQLITVTASEED